MLEFYVFEKRVGTLPQRVTGLKSGNVSHNGSCKEEIGVGDTNLDGQFVTGWFCLILSGPCLVESGGCPNGGIEPLQSFIIPLQPVGFHQKQAAKFAMQTK